MKYTTAGNIRGCCGHNHRNFQTAKSCLERDQKRCKGNSDRKIGIYIEYLDIIYGTTASGKLDKSIMFLGKWYKVRRE